MNQKRKSYTQSVQELLTVLFPHAKMYFKNFNCVLYKMLTMKKQWFWIGMSENVNANQRKIIGGERQCWPETEGGGPKRLAAEFEMLSPG